MREPVKYCFTAIGGAVFGYAIAFFVNENSALAILIALFCLMVVLFVFYKIDNNQYEALKTAQDSLIDALNTSIGRHSESLKQRLSEGTAGLRTATTAYHQEAQSLHLKKSAFVGLIKYHIFAAAIRSLRQTRNAEKTVKFVRKELEVLEKIEAGEDVFALCGNRAHAEEQALNTLLGRINNGALEPKTAFFRCKSCGAELDACAACGGELERRFKK
ncbi:MAG TPA: hypothetical protein PLA72_11115 [Smithellaceae bacterium]|nr:hypothetical protein [Smithellaceae bacterium]